MRYAILLLVLAIACPLTQWAADTLDTSPTVTPTPSATPAPTWTPAVNVPSPHVEISASATTLHVGETVTITGRQVNIGMPAFTLTLSSGAVMLVNHMNENLSGTDRDQNFEVVSAQSNLNEAVFTLRALAPGEVDVVINAYGRGDFARPQLYVGRRRFSAAAPDDPLSTAGMSYEHSSNAIAHTADAAPNSHDNANAGCRFP